MINKETRKEKSIELFMQEGLYRRCTCGHSHIHPYCNGFIKQVEELKID